MLVRNCRGRGFRESVPRYTPYKETTMPLFESAHSAVTGNGYGNGNGNGNGNGVGRGNGV